MENKLHSLSRKVLLLMFGLQLPSVHILMKYLPHNFYWGIPIYLITMAFFYWYLLSDRQSSLPKKWILNQNLTLVFLISLILVAIFFLYPHELALQAKGLGSDASDALIKSGHLLIEGQYPYATKTYLNNPISPGVGWIVLMLPFICTDLYILATPLLVLVSAIMIKIITNNVAYSNLYVLLLCSSLQFWHISVTGVDYIAVGICFCMATVALFYYWNTRKNIILIILISLLATARASFFYLGPLLGFFLWKKEGRIGIYMGAISLFLTLLIHAIFYFWSPNQYAPLHIFHTRTGFLPHFYLFALIFCAFIAAVTWVQLKPTLSSWLFYLWLCLMTPLFVLDIAPFIISNFKPYMYLGRYTSITVPVLALWGSLSMFRCVAPELKSIRLDN